MGDSRESPGGQALCYSLDRVSRWLRRIDLPESLRQHIASPQAIPKKFKALRILMRCQIATFTYENFSVHYSPTHPVDIRPESLYEKLMGPNNRNRGGYCMELSIFFYHMLRGIGFHVYMTGVRNRTRTNGVPGGQYQGWCVRHPRRDSITDTSQDAYQQHSAPTHRRKVRHRCSLWRRWRPTTPLPLNVFGIVFNNLGPQQVRLVHDLIPKQHTDSSKLWIYQYRNGAHIEWNSFYSFAEIEFFQEDFEVMNWWASAKTVHRWTVIAVRFLREGDGVLFSQRGIVRKMMLVNDVMKVNMGGKTEIARRFETESGRLEVIRDYFGIELTQEEEDGIRGWDMALK